MAAAIIGSPALLILGLSGLLVTPGLVLHSIAQGAWVIRKVTRDWDQPSELTEVRRNRPHAGERDPDLPHDEFAVTVEETGHLCLWRFRPLAIGESVDADSVLAPGRPMYSADVIAEREFDAQDASVAAEQLAAAQEDAAARERDAITEVQQLAVEAARHAELSAETKSTAAALQHLTGQHRR
ncbi:MAG: hypothetical protein JHC95_13505 [Solirubrobacteraceae bacterium]|nr:hypothetical protein [Solirubrobacteraceae bacterium]